MLSRFIPASRQLVVPLEQVAVRAFTAAAASQNAGMELIEKKFQESVNQVLKIWTEDEEKLAALKTEMEGIKWPVGGSDAEIATWSKEVDAIYKKVGVPNDLEVIGEDMGDSLGEADNYREFLAGLGSSMTPAVHTDMMVAFDKLCETDIDDAAFDSAWETVLKEIGAKHGLGDITDDAAVRVAAAKSLFKAIEGNVLTELKAIQAKMGAPDAKVDLKASVPKDLFSEA